MTNPIPINLAVEDALTESVVTKLLRHLPKRYATRTVYNQGGFGYLKKNIGAFNNAAKGTPYLVVTDLDRYQCPSDLIERWLAVPRHHNLILRVAVSEVEAWVLADRDSLAAFLGIRVELIPEDVEGLADPKAVLIEVARRSPRKDIREDICPPTGSTRTIGPNYNGRLGSYIENSWNIGSATQRSESLRKTITRLTEFEPRW